MPITGFFEPIKRNKKMNTSGVCMTGVWNAVFMGSGCYSTGSFGYAPKQEEMEWINDPQKVPNEYLYQLGREDPIGEMINGRMVPYVRRYAPKKKLAELNQPRENNRPAPSAKGIKKQVRVAGFGENQKLKL